ncbi:hypothetical protein Fluta_4074 [Fluviicola taffensis DSM 16823]|uniref:Uncharacterized protein n=1 Tax=Fluviicola taffensis (strain DSM 16823 / NCIMB 13979 / RW262) TaxID=755732 RepID=F2IJD9_FLUTR|nr:hypothetical protein Fluta_4074 [Fluviicola taffensis DSM 16823]
MKYNKIIESDNIVPLSIIPFGNISLFLIKID